MDEPVLCGGLMGRFVLCASLASTITFASIAIAQDAAVGGPLQTQTDIFAGQSGQEAANFAAASAGGSLEVGAVPGVASERQQDRHYAYLLETLELSKTYTIGVIIATSIALMIVLVVLLRTDRRRAGWTKMNLAALILPLICGGALAMVSAGFSRDQMLAPMTLFATVVGYL